MSNHQFKLKKEDEYNTPRQAVLPIIEFIPKNSVIWCPFDLDNSAYVTELTKNGFKVISTHIDKDEDFFNFYPTEDFDVIISNPPYSKRELVLERLFEIGKPFAILINDTGLFDSKKRYDLFSNNKFEIMVLSKRVNYYYEGRLLKGVPFRSIYLCSQLLPEKIVFKNLNN